MACLTRRELEILQLLIHDKTNREIASELKLSVKTIENHLHTIYMKLNVKGRAGAVAHALLNNLIQNPNEDYEEPSI